MKYYYNGALILSPLNITSNEPVWSTTSVSMKEIRASQGGQRWELQFEVKTTTNAVDLFMAGIQEVTAPAEMIMPQMPEVNDRFTFGGGTGPSLVDTVHPAGADEVDIHTSGNTGLIPKGTFIQFNPYKKVYVVTEDVVIASGASVGTIPIYPGLREIVAQGSAVNTGVDCKLTYVKDVANIRGIVFNEGIVASPGGVTLLETT